MWLIIRSWVVSVFVTLVILGSLGYHAQPRDLWKYWDCVIPVSIVLIPFSILIFVMVDISDE